MDTVINKKEQTRERTARNRREAADQNESLFFEMSEIVESPEMLKSWVEWFRRLHIPCAIAKTEGGYTLWRKGREVGRKRSSVRSFLTKENIVFSIGVTARELNLLKEIQQEGDDEGRSQSSEGFEELALSHWEELQEGLKLDSASPSSPGQKAGTAEGPLKVNRVQEQTGDAEESHGYR
jgi:hypothetical protein